MTLSILVHMQGSVEREAKLSLKLSTDIADITAVDQRMASASSRLPPLFTSRELHGSVVTYTARGSQESIDEYQQHLLNALQLFPYRSTSSYDENGIKKENDFLTTLTPPMSNSDCDYSNHDNCVLSIEIKNPTMLESVLEEVKTRYPTDKLSFIGVETEIEILYQKKNEELARTAERHIRNYIQSCVKKMQNPNQMEINLKNGLMVILKKGNILEETVEAIINPANSGLQHLGGLAFQINQATNGYLQKKSDEFIKKHGALQNTSFVVQVPDKFNRYYWHTIVNIVAPDNHLYNLPQNEIAAGLKTATQSILHAALKYKLKNIAVPAIGCGIFRIDPVIVADVMLETLQSANLTSSVALREIRLVIFPPEMEAYAAFERKLNSSAGPSISSVSQPNYTQQQVPVCMLGENRVISVRKAHILHDNHHVKVFPISYDSSIQHMDQKYNELNTMLDGALLKMFNARYQFRNQAAIDIFAIQLNNKPKITGSELVIVNLTNWDGNSILENMIIPELLKVCDNLEHPSMAIPASLFAQLLSKPINEIVFAFMWQLKNHKYVYEDAYTQIDFVAFNESHYSEICQSLVSGKQVLSLGTPI